MQYDLVRVGHTRKAVGFDGSLRIVVDDKYLEDLLNAEAYFIEYGYEIIPFFPEHVESDDDLVVRFDDIQDKESVTKITGKPIYLRKSEISLKSEEIDGEGGYDLNMLVGMMLVDRERGQIGRVGRVETYPQQIMMIVERKAGDLLVPLHQELVISFDAGKEILMDLPEGLLDL